MKFMLAFAISTLLMTPSTWACLPNPGTQKFDIVIRDRVVGTFFNTVEENRSLGSIEVLLKNSVGRITLKVTSVTDQHNQATTRINTNFAEIQGQYLRGGEVLEIWINNDLVTFAPPVTRCM